MFEVSRNTHRIPWDERYIYRPHLPYKTTSNQLNAALDIQSYLFFAGVEKNPKYLLRRKAFRGYIRSHRILTIGTTGGWLGCLGLRSSSFGRSWRSSPCLRLACSISPGEDPAKCKFCTHRIHGTGIFTNIYHEFMPNVGKYTIHGSYGIWRWQKISPKKI